MKIKEQEVYHAVWVKYLPVITLKLKQTIRNGEPSHVGMYRFEFHGSGNKRKVGHQFDLELKNGRVMNDISKAPLARELNTVMREDQSLWPLVYAGHFSFALDGNFIFTIDKR